MEYKHPLRRIYKVYYMILIKLLKQHPDTITNLAYIWYDLLGKIWSPDMTIDSVIRRFSTHLNDENLPITFIALDGNTPIGMCSLRENDGIRLDLTPWLGSVVVDSQYQKKGIGKQLIDTACIKAKEFGFKKLYLFTFDSTLPQYYEKLGWRIMGTEDFKNQPVTLMEIEL